MPPDESIITIHGRHVALRHGGRGPVVLLVHGLAGDLHTWDRVLPNLAPRHCVVAPDLPGHGRSDPPAGDYSLGAHASWLRDVLDALGHDSATVVGHSLGGGIAMQFAYQHPERCDRLVLVASGGLGPDLNAVVRAASLPGSELALSLLAHRHVIAAASWIVGCAGTLGLRVPRECVETARSYARLAQPTDRRSFINSLRAVVDHRGQRISASDHLHLLADVPTLIVWGTADRIIPVEHAYAAHHLVPGAQLELYTGAGHFPHVAEPHRFATTVEAFIAGTGEERRRARNPRGALSASRSGEHG